MANRTVISLFLLLAVLSYCRGQGAKPIRRFGQVGPAKRLNPSGNAPVPRPQAAYHYPTYPYYPQPAPYPYPIYPIPAPPAPPAPVPDTGSKVTCDICEKVENGFIAVMARLIAIENKLDEDKVQRKK